MSSAWGKDSMPSAAWQACRAAMARPGCSLKHRHPRRAAAQAALVVLSSLAVSHLGFVFIKCIDYFAVIDDFSVIF
jgi:hypothetical protein